jgi:hypothetical protein
MTSITFGYSAVKKGAKITLPAVETQYNALF